MTAETRTEATRRLFRQRRAVDESAEEQARDSARDSVQDSTGDRAGEPGQPLDEETSPAAGAEPVAQPAEEIDYDTGPKLGRRSTFYVLRKTVREFGDDGGTDLAASLTYYSVLALFPAAIALLSLLGVVGEAHSSVDAVLDVLRPLVSAGTLDDISGPLHTMAQSQGASWALLFGVLGALWSASAYVGAFGRAMNRVYEVDEGRPIWRLRPMNVLVTLVTVVLCAAALVILVVSGPVAESVGDRIGLGSEALTVWDIAKWPALAIVVVLVVAILYHFTPNAKPPRFRVLSVGAFVALLVWVAASVGFAFFVANFSSYDKTYGSVAGAIVLLLWLWLTNVALVFGAELDSEIERARELHEGLPAEAQLQLDVRSRRGIDKAARRREKDLAAGRAIRESRVGSGDPGDRPF